MPTKQTDSITVFQLIGTDRHPSSWGWYVALGIVQFLIGAIAVGLLIYGRVILLMGTSLWHQWLAPILWVLNLLISTHMIFNGLALIRFGLIAKNRSADTHPSLPEATNLKGFEQSDMPDCLVHSQSDP